MTKEFTVKQRLKYFFDNTLSRGTISIIIWLAIVSLVLIIVFASIYAISGINMQGTEGMGFFEALWQSLMRSLDPGTVAADEGWMFRGIGIIITISGIFILSTLIGVLSSGLDDKLQDLRKGRSLVIEEGHTLILGWSPKIYHIIEELVIANENQHKPRIVILSERDKVEMEDDLKDNISNCQNTKIICRTGSHLDVVDLEKVNIHSAKSVIVLSPETDNPDTLVVKTVLAITHNPNRKIDGSYHIVAEIKDESNMEAATLVGKDEAIYILTPDLTARIMAQTSRQSGLSIVYMQLLCYEGDEIYFYNEPKLGGKTFKEALFAYNDSTIIGYKNINGDVKLNPPMDSVLSELDEIIVISEDDDTVVLSGMTNYNVNMSLINTTERQSNSNEERNLILGWNEKGETIIRELDNYVSSGSEVHILSEVDIDIAMFDNLKNQKVTFENGNISDRKTLINCDVTSFNNVILVGYQHIPPQEADAKTLISLLHIRNIADAAKKKVNIVSEMFEQSNRELASVTKADDFIVSEDLISRMLTQLSESKDLNKVLDDLFDADGSEIYLKDITNYVSVGEPVSFYTLLESAAQKGETAIGYRKLEHAYSVLENYGIVINPKKDELITFTSTDKLIVLAED